MSPDQGDGGCTPHFLFGCAEKETGRARSSPREEPPLRVGCAPKHLAAARRNGTLSLICLCPGAPVLLKFSAVRPRRTCFVRRRVQDRFALLLPAAAALPTSNRHSRYHPGSAERSGERGKRRWSNPTTTHERSTHAPKCGEALLCSPRLKRTRQETINSPGHRLARPPSAQT